ncbi:MAG: hypothetical protein M3372_02280 [Verrucomicrobiota bacterium]|nr:hypothetical protein [Verrucomicrobiota bacterium]
MRRLFATAVLAVFTFVLHAPAAVFTVTSTANTGVGSLRQAITDANDAAGADVINFNIQGTGVQVIALSSALPVITGSVTIDGYLQQPERAQTPSAAGIMLSYALNSEAAGQAVPPAQAASRSLRETPSFAALRSTASLAAAST